MKRLVCIMLSAAFITTIFFGTAFAVAAAVAPIKPTTGSSHFSSTGTGGPSTTTGTQNNMNNNFHNKSSGFENTGFPK